MIVVTTRLSRLFERGSPNTERIVLCSSQIEVRTLGCHFRASQPVIQQDEARPLWVCSWDRVYLITQVATRGDYDTYKLKRSL